MLDLIFKDVVASRWFLLIGLPIYAAQLVGMSSSPPAFLFITLLFSGFSAFGPIAIEEVQRTEILWCSLPLSRRDVVLGRYGSTLLGMVAGLGASWTLGRIVRAIVPSEPASTTAPIGPEAYAALFLLLAILTALFLPCYFRLGAGKGLFAFAVITLSLFVAVAIGGSAVASLVGAGEALADPRSIDPAAVEAFIKQWSWVGSVVMTLAALFVITISAALSVRFYRTRDC